MDPPPKAPEDKPFRVQFMPSELDAFLIENKVHSPILTENGLETTTNITRAQKFFPYQRFKYMSHRGKAEWRRVIPLRTFFGVTDYHTDPQWLLTAVCRDRRAVRVFAVENILVMGGLK